MYMSRNLIIYQETYVSLLQYPICNSFAVLDMIVLTTYCIYVSNRNFVTILKILVVLTDISFWQMNVCQFAIVISAKNKPEIFFGIVIFADFTLNVIKIEFLLNNSFSDGNRKKSSFKAYLNFGFL